MRTSQEHLSSGRAGQKARTHQALVRALHGLLAEGADPSVAEVAEAAGISRTTAYRYFPDRLALLQAALPETGRTSLLGPDAPAGARERLEVVLAAHFDFLLQWEPQLRAALRSSLTPGAAQPSLRGGRAVAWYADALSPLGSERPDLDRHSVAVRLRSVAGIESFVWLTDVAGLGADAACAVMRLNALAVFDSATA